MNDFTKARSFSEGVADIRARFDAIQNNKTLSAVERKLAWNKLLRSEEAELKALQDELPHRRDRIAAIEWTAALLKRMEADISLAVLTAPGCSRVHRFAQAMREGRFYCLRKDKGPGDTNYADGVASEISLDTFQVFVAKHRWASLIPEAESEDEIRLPYERCIFEYCLAGAPIVVLAIEDPSAKSGISASISVETENGAWFELASAAPDTEDTISQVASEIRAVCIALDAEAATVEVQRAPAALNKKRERSGKAPLPDVRIVDLSKRHRTATPPPGPGVDHKTHVRLHFRRGHWRHYATFRTWINWCLVGDPDLGFVDKEYRL